MSALQDSSHSREQSLDRKPAEVSQHRLVQQQQFDVMSNNKIKTLAPHQLLAQQNLAPSVTIVSAALSVAPRVALPSTILQQALGPRVAGFVPRIEHTASIMSTHSGCPSNSTLVTAKVAFPPHQQQQVAVNLSTNTLSSSSSVPPANQTPASGQGVMHHSIYGIGSTLAGRQIPMVQPRMSVTAPIGSVTIPKMISDRLQATPQSTPGSHLPKGAMAAASILTAPKAGHAAIARPMTPSAAAIQVQPPMLGSLVIQSPAAQHAKMIMPGARPLPPSVPRSSLPTVSLVTTSVSRVPSVGLQPQMPWSNSATIQVPVLPAKSLADVSASLAMGTPSSTNILQQAIRPIGHIGTQQAPPLAIRPPVQPQKVLLSSPLTSPAATPMTRAPPMNVNVTRVTGPASDIAANHSVVPAIARPTLVSATPLPVVSAPQGLLGGNGAALPVTLAQNVPQKTHKVVLSKATLPSISVNKIGVPVVSVQAMANVGIKPQTTTTLASSITAVPVAKVPPHAFTVQQLPGDGQSAATCRLVSPIGQTLPQQPQQQQPRPTMPPGSQIIPIQQNAVFISSSCLSSTALPAALSIPVTSTDARQSNEHGPVLHQVSYAIPDGARYLTPQHLMSLTSTYAGLQPVQALTFQASNIRPGSVTSQTPTLAASLQGSTNTGSPLSSVVGMANPAGRLNTSVVVAMDTSRLASLAIPSNFATADATGRPAESAVAPIGIALNQGTILPQPQPLQQQPPPPPPQPAMIALMQPLQPATAAAAASVSTDSMKQQTMSPRPPILRKRQHDTAMMSGAKKNLFSPLTTVNSEVGVLGGGAVAVTSAADVAAQLVLTSPKSFDASRENSQSSTDTASSAESTPRSCPPSASRVKEEPQDCFENGGPPVNDLGLKIIPRKKPRKQSLHANEEILDGFSSDEDNQERPPANLNLSADIGPMDDEPEHRGAFAPAEYVDDEGFRWTRTRPKNVTIAGEYTWNSKPRNNHFVCFSDVKLKDERRPTVNELANTIGIQQNASGAKIKRLMDQFSQLIELETEDYDRMKSIQVDFPTKLGSKHFSSDDELRSVGEIVLANVQRCHTYIEQLVEVHDSLKRILNHKQQTYEIIAKHQSKRTVKKKERS